MNEHGSDQWSELDIQPQTRGAGRSSLSSRVKHASTKGDKSLSTWRASTTTYDISGLGARAGSTPPPAEPPFVTRVSQHWSLTQSLDDPEPAGSDQWAAQEVPAPVLQARLSKAYPYGDPQQAQPSCGVMDPVLSSTPPPVVGLFGGRRVASPCWARR